MSHRSSAALLAAVLLLAAAPAAAQPAGSRVLVMPFDNPLREPRLHWIGEAASLLIADELNARGVSAIRRVERIRAFEQLHLPVAATLSRATIVKVGQLVGASEVIVGSVRFEGEALVVEANGIRIDVGRVQSPVTERGPLDRRRSAVRTAVGEARVRGAAAGAAQRAAAARGVRGVRQGTDGREHGHAAPPSSKRPSRSIPSTTAPTWRCGRCRHDQADYAAAVAAAQAVPAAVAAGAAWTLLRVGVAPRA